MRKIQFWLYIGCFLFWYTGCGEKGEEKELYPGIVTATNRLVLRTGPAVTNAKLLGMPWGTRVAVLATNGPAALIGGEYDNWYRLRVGTNTGWAFGGFINRLGTNYVPRDVNIDQAGFLSLSTEPLYAHLNTDAGRFYTMRPDALLFSHKEWAVFYNRLKGLFNNKAKGQSVSLRLLLSNIKTVVGAIFPGGQEIRLRYYAVKQKRFIKEDIRSLKARVIEYIPPGQASLMRTDKGFLGNFTGWTLLHYDIPVSKFIDMHFMMQTNGFIPRRNRVFSFRYLPVDCLQKYNLGSHLAFTNAMSGESPYLGILLGIE